MSQPQPIRFSRIGEALEEPVINELMSIALERPETLSLAAGITDNNALPCELVHRIIGELPETNPGNEYLQYGTTAGRRLLRELTCSWLQQLPGEQASAYSPELTYIANGSQQALFLATHTLCDPGDCVLVESPSYFVYLSMLNGLGVTPVGIPALPDGSMDHEGLKQLLEAYRSRGELHRFKAAYLIGYHANPSSRSLSLQEKTGFAEILSRFSLFLPVLEDGAYRDLAYRGHHPVPSVMSLDAFQSFPKLYLGTYTKPFASGLKIGFACCSDQVWHAKMLQAKGNQDFGTANFAQSIIEQAILRGDYQRLLPTLGQHYHSKAMLLNQTLEQSGLRNLGWQWSLPEGGLLFWLKAPESINTNLGDAFWKRCVDRGVIYVPGNFCFAKHTPSHFIRLSIGSLPDAKLKQAAERFCSVAQKFAKN